MATALKFKTGDNKPTDQHPVAFSALTLLVGLQAEHPALKI